MRHVHILPPCRVARRQQRKPIAHRIVTRRTPRYGSIEAIYIDACGLPPSAREVNMITRLMCCDRSHCNRRPSIGYCRAGTQATFHSTFV